MENEFCFTFFPNACKSCGGKCCIGESGYVFVSVKEMDKISNFLQIPFEDFTLRYIRKVGYRFSLIEKPFENGAACVFFDEQYRRCLIYDVRPKQCIDFPFWDGFKYKNKIDLDDLTRLCPGVKYD